MRWKTLEEGIQQLREVAVLEVLFGRGGQHDNDPDKVRCTGQMLWNLATLGPSRYATFIATIHPDNNRETVGSVANKLRNYESIISGPMQAQVSAMAKELKEKMEEVTEEIREVREEMRKNSSHVAPVRVTGPRVRAQRPPARERGYTPRADLWYFLRDCGEDMGRWDGKPTSALAAWLRELKERNTNRGSSTKMKVASTSHDQAASQGEARENRVYWTVWIQWPGTSEPQKYEALVDTGSQCTLIPSEYVGTEPISIAGVTGGSQELTLLEAEVSLTGEAWQVDYITLPQTRQGKRYVLTMVEATTGWLETYPVPHATARNTILSLEKQILWRHGTPERIESDNGTHFKNSLINTWAREHGIEWVCHIPYHAPAAGKVEQCNGLLKTTLKALGRGTFKNWENNLAKATWLVNTRGSTNRAGPAQSEPLGTRDEVPVVHMRGMLGKTVWINSASSKDNPVPGVVFAQGPGCTWWVMQKDGETRCIPQGDLVFR
ncbi:hypothetical protein DUI87_03269 [Hirundo rustica rustica]|uniref:Integrase catalytic domain-containing protein n=1 Tax=Hirundo rustica rustica TaxID=333673 RepID=A0A3M0L2N7_HIRRU|nr:hypothetical protein DUI87_03269 [Hirundo rustica rustica]